MFNQLEYFKKTSETLKEATLAENNRSPLKETLLFILLYIAMFLITGLFTYVITIGIPVDSDYFVLLLSGSFIVSIIITLLAITKIEKRSLRSIGFSHENVVPNLVKGLSIGFIMFILVVVIGMLLGQYTFNGFDFSSLYLAIPYIIVFIIQPFGEEIYTRGWIIPLFSKNYSVFISIVVSTLFFVAGHMGNNGFNLIALINIMLVSVLLSLLFLKYDNIWICGAFHSAWNFTQSYLLGFNVSGLNTSSIMHFSQSAPNIINGGAFGPEAGLITTVIFILVIILLWKVDI
ncbi:MAG: CPBP family intramembrane metalloprotease [Methanosphaera stadtmanae]|nr:CPBP family intramembrane metalloprotease [Methanosphaera stadtmanae]